MNRLDYTVAAEIGAFVQNVAALEIDGADLLHLSLELLPEKGSELSKRYPRQLSEKLKSLPALVHELGIEFESELSLLVPERTGAVLDLRNRLAHSKITQITGRKSKYALNLVKMSQPQKVSDGTAVEWLNRQILTLTSDELHEACWACERMIDEVEKIRLKVWKQFKSWPNYMVIQQKRAIDPTQIIPRQVESIG